MTDTSKTRLELVAMALDELMAVGSGQSPDSEDTEKVNSRFDGLMAELSARGIVSISDEDDIPIEWTGPLAELLANECANAFGKPKMPRSQREEIEDRLLVIINRSTTPDKMTLDSTLQQGAGYLSLARWTRGG